jgi:AcrR family transcriptional regulator
MVQIQNSRSERVRPARLQRRTDARRLGILSAAARVFRRRGYVATGMREIAEEADLSPGNLYYYFSGKDELLYFCQDRWLDRMLSALAQTRKARGPARETLDALLRTHVICLLDELEGGAAHLEIDDLPARLRGALIAKRDRYERGVRALVAGGIARGEFAPCDPAIVTRAILGALNWSARWYRPHGAQTAGEVADVLVAYLVRGLAARAPAGSKPPAPRRRRSPETEQ